MPCLSPPRAVGCSQVPATPTPPSALVQPSSWRSTLRPSARLAPTRCKQRATFAALRVRHRRHCRQWAAPTAAAFASGRFLKRVPLPGSFARMLSTRRRGRSSDLYSINPAPAQRSSDRSKALLAAAISRGTRTGRKGSALLRNRPSEGATRRRRRAGSDRCRIGGRPTRGPQRQGPQRGGPKLGAAHRTTWWVGNRRTTWA
eukprot:18233-Chlamydomonas_euryale.AAC.3